MELGTISDMILQNTMVLNAQPKWTFGKNTCNTYEVFAAYFKAADGNLIPSWPILEIIERNERKLNEKIDELVKEAIDTAEVVIAK